MNSSAIPAVGDCGFFLSSLCGDFGGGGALVGSEDVFWAVPNALENLDKSLRKASICSESLI